MGTGDNGEVEEDDDYPVKKKALKPNHQNKLKG